MFNLKSLDCEVIDIHSVAKDSLVQRLVGFTKLWRSNTESGSLYNEDSSISLILISKLKLAIFVDSSEVASLVDGFDPLKGGVGRETTSPMLVEGEFNTQAIFRGTESTAISSSMPPEEIADRIAYLHCSAQLVMGGKFDCFQFENMFSIFFNGDRPLLLLDVKGYLNTKYDLDIIDTVHKDLIRLEDNPITRSDLIIFPALSFNLAEDVKKAKLNYTDMKTSVNTLDTYQTNRHILGDTKPKE